MHCAIYKGIKKPGDYLYVEKVDDFSRIPQTLLDMMGELKLVMNLELSPERKLAQTDVNKVMASLTEQGYYLQIPPQIHEINLLEDQRKELGLEPLPERDKYTDSNSD